MATVASRDQQVFSWSELGHNAKRRRQWCGRLLWVRLLGWWCSLAASSRPCAILLGDWRSLVTPSPPWPRLLVLVLVLVLALAPFDATMTGCWSCCRDRHCACGGCWAATVLRVNLHSQQRPRCVQECAVSWEFRVKRCRHAGVCKQASAAAVMQNNAWRVLCGAIIH